MRIRPVLPHPTDQAAALVELTQGLWAVIDAADAKEVGRFNWHAYASKAPYAKATYAKRCFRDEHGSGHTVLLHRFIGELAGLSLVADVDHRDRNGLNCRRSNLRDATPSQNGHNAGLRSHNTSGVKGVHWDVTRGLWMVRVGVNGKQFNLGRFSDLGEAERVAREARERIHGEFANHGSN